MLNEFFPHIFCINLNRRPDRLEEFTDMAKHHGFDFTRWEATDGRLLKHPNGQPMEENERRQMELACKISHLRLIRHAKEEGLGWILIFEDDARLVEGYERLLKGLFTTGPYGNLYFSRNNNNQYSWNWDMFYLGFNDINKTAEPLGNNIVRVRTGFTTHAYAVNFPAYDKIIEAFDYRGQADVLYADYIHPLGNSYAISPNIAYQADGFSDITLKDENYTQLR
jgi:GR25 family glycosyltransferase involved in LPS biosynthesis